MDIGDQFSLDHLLFKERRCRSCGKTKDLLSDFYLSRKNRDSVSSSYSYECKECTSRRIIESRKKSPFQQRWEYPDW